MSVSPPMAARNYAAVLCQFRFDSCRYSMITFLSVILQTQCVDFIQIACSVHFGPENTKAGRKAIWIRISITMITKTVKKHYNSFQLHKLITLDWHAMPTSYHEWLIEQISKAHKICASTNIQSCASYHYKWTNCGMLPTSSQTKKVLLYTPAQSSTLRRRSAELVHYWKGPFTILEKLGPDRYSLAKIDGSSIQNVRPSRLKFYYEWGPSVSEPPDVKYQATFDQSFPNSGIWSS